MNWLEAMEEYAKYRMKKYNQCPICGGGLDSQYNRGDWIYVCMDCEAEFDLKTLFPVIHE